MDDESQIESPEITPTVYLTTISQPTESTGTPTQITTQTPIQTLTELEAIDIEMQGIFGNVDPCCTSDVEPCDSGNSNFGCSLYLSTKPITKTEWGELFPNTRFYLIGFHRITNPESFWTGYTQRNIVIAQQDGNRYTVESYDKLLAANEIVITDENRELIAKSFALMSLGNFLEDEITFLNWEEGSWPSAIKLNFDHKLSVWTGIQGFTVDYLFGFYKDRLVMIGWWTTEFYTGEYIEEPSILPPQDDIYYKQN